MTIKEGLCKRIILSIFFLLVLCRTAGAQDSQKATLTAADAGTCAATSTACLVINIPSGSGGATFNIGANASANTVQFEVSADYGTTWVALSVTPSSSTTTVTSTTSTGAWQANVAGYTKARMRISTLVGGNTTTYINLSTASARSGGGAGLPTGCTPGPTNGFTCTGNVLGANLPAVLPTTPNGVSFIDTSTPAGGVGVAPAWSWPGVPGRSNAGATDTIAATDRGAGILETNGGAVAVSLPQAGTTNFANNFDFFLKCATTTVCTITPTTSQIAGNNGTLGATLVMPASSTAYCYSFDNTNYQCGVVSSGTGTVTTTGSPASSYCAYFSGATSIIGTANCTLDSSGNFIAAGNLASTAANIYVGNAAGSTVSGIIRLTGIFETNSSGAYRIYCGSNISSSSACSGVSGDGTVGVVDIGNGTPGDVSGTLKTTIAKNGCGAIFPSVNVTPVTVNANVTSDQNLMALTLAAGCLNKVGRGLRIYAAGVYSTAATSTAQITMKAELCTVSGCGSGTVVAVCNIQTIALASVTVTNNTWAYDCLPLVQTAGASAVFERSGKFSIDLGSLTTAADSIFLDPNATAVTSAIDSTAGLFLQITGAFSAGSTSNAFTERQLVVEVLN